MIRRLGLEQEIERDYVSKYERGILEPTLNVLLAYARAISSTGHGEFLETLIDDKQNLPVKLPATRTVNCVLFAPNQPERQRKTHPDFRKAQSI